MAVFGKRITKAYLNPDLCFCAWLIGGSIAKAQQRLINEGVMNPATGHPPSRMGIWFATMRSPLYVAFIQRRKDKNLDSERPSKEEFDGAIVAIKTILAKLHEDREAEARQDA